MKKFILLSLLSAVSAWADVSTVVSPPTAVDPACVAAVTAAASATSASVTQSCPATYTVTATYTPPIVVPPPLPGVQIKTKAGYCLDAATPAGIVQQACDTTKASQAFSTAIAGRYAVAGQCLALSSTLNGTQLSMAACTDPSTAWTTPAGNLKNTATGKCIDIPLSQVNVAGAIAQGWSCDSPTSTEQMFTTPAIGGVVNPPPPPPPTTGGVTAAMWAEIATQRLAFGDPNDCKARVDAIPTTGFTLPAGGNIASALASNSVVLLQTGVYPVSMRFGVPPGKVLAAAPGQAPVIDLKTATDWWVIGVGNNATFAGIEVRNSPGWGLTTFNLPGGTYANGGLIYNVVVHDNGMDSRAADNGTGIVVTGGAKNWCVVDAEVYNTYNAGGSGATANGGNSDGIANNFGASQNSFINVRAHNNGDDGFDMWQGGQSYWYFSSASDNGKVPGKAVAGDGNGIKLGTGSVSHKFYKTSANNNKEGGFNLNGNTQQPTLVQTSATGNPAGNYMNGVNPPPPPPPASGAQTVTFTQSNEDFLNPGRGFYVSPKPSEMNVTQLTNFVNYWKTRLFLYSPDLSPYRNATLPASYLATLNTQLAAARSAGVKLIIWPQYNSDPGGADAPIGLALQHIQQLGAVWAKNADIIPFFKAGYIGSYGEWWGSQNGLDSDANKLAIKNAILANTPASSMVYIRTPRDIQKWYSTPAAAAAARIAFHNDCYMANDTDANTFSGLNDPLRTYAKGLTTFGFETCDNVSNPEQMRKTCAQALSENAAYKATWGNKSYAPTFIDSWTAGGCLDQISRSFGYRYFVSSINHDGATPGGQPTTITARVQNVGNSGLFDDRALIITLRNQATGAPVSGQAGKLRLIAGGASATMSAVLTAPAGTYDILLSAPDPSPSIAGDARYAVRFANMDVGPARWVAPHYQTGAVLVVTP